jgi:sigma-B regulation protein RsbU (phosphoserine phosphatase)
VSSSPSSEHLPSDKELFDFLLEHIPDQVYFKDREGNFLRISRAVAEYMKASDPREVIGKSDFDFWNEETARAAAEDEKRVMESGEAMVGKIERLIYPNGRVAFDYTTKMPLKDSQGRIIGICGINKDFTHVMEIEEALREERNRLRIITAELKERNAQIEADLQMAREVQEALLPSAFQAIPYRADSLSFAHFYLPAGTVGGDFFHIFPLSEGRSGVFICDVMGHGVRAALITAVIRALIEELRSMMLNPGRFLGALNLRLRAILERVEEPFVATAFYLIANPNKGELLFANAAHPKPSRLRKGSGLIGVLGAKEQCGGPALGLFDEATYRTASSPFEEGDRIVLFTDGVHEVESKDGEEFGIDALQESLGKHADLPANELFTAVLSDVRDFTGKSEFDDDVCLVSVERVTD